MGKLIAYPRLFLKFYRTVPGLITLAVILLFVSIELAVWWAQTKGLSSANLIAVAGAIQVVGVLFLVSYLVSRIYHDGKRWQDDSQRVQALAMQTVSAELADLAGEVAGLADESALTVLRDQLKHQIETSASEQQAKLRREFGQRLESSAAELRIALAALVREEIDQRVDGQHESDSRFHSMGMRILQLRNAMIRDQISGQAQNGKID